MKELAQEICDFLSQDIYHTDNMLDCQVDNLADFLSSYENNYNNDYIIVKNSKNLSCPLCKGAG